MPIGKPKPQKQAKKSRKARTMPRRKQVEQQLESIVKRIVFWRDGSECVLRHIDGGRCRGKMNWGHFVPRKSSRFLKYDLATFVQCDGHNFLHDRSDPIFGLWFSKTFGLAAHEALSVKQRANTGANYEQSTQDLEVMLERYLEMYDNRFYVGLDLDSLITAGYYGQTVADAYGPQSISEARESVNM